MEHATFTGCSKLHLQDIRCFLGIEVRRHYTGKILFIVWNGETHPFEAWNADQTCSLAMTPSVNWYSSISR